MRSKNDTFVSIIGTTSYDVTYTDASGEAVTHTWENTNQYLTGNATTPDGFQIVGEDRNHGRGGLLSGTVFV